MKKQKIFEGVGTALVTPFRDGKIDFTALLRLINMQIDSGVSAIIISGTTGECATLKDNERYSLFEAARDMVSGRAKLIFGTGTNDTDAAIKHTVAAEKYSPDGILVVTPYYNKGTERGVVEHYEAIIKSTDLPIIVYNVPSRTGVNLSIDTLKSLSKHESVVGIKEAGDSLSRYVRLSDMADELPLYAGNDNQIYPALALGGAGVISVVSNVLPRNVVELCTLFSSGRLSEARLAQLKLLPLIDALFSETNPAPVKWLLHSLGVIGDEIRLPLTMPCEETKSRLTDAYKRLVEG